MAYKKARDKSKNLQGSICPYTLWWPGRDSGTRSGMDLYLVLNTRRCWRLCTKMCLAVRPNRWPWAPKPLAIHLLHRERTGCQQHCRRDQYESLHSLQIYLWYYWYCITMLDKIKQNKLGMVLLWEWGWTRSLDDLLRSLPPLSFYDFMITSVHRYKFVIIINLMSLL